MGPPRRPERCPLLLPPALSPGRAELGDVDIHEHRHAQEQRGRPNSRTDAVRIADQPHGIAVDQRPTGIRSRAIRKPLGDVEGTAAQLVARQTGAQVFLQDDNRGSEGKPDLRVEYHDGRTAVIEVVTDIEPGRAAVIQAARQDHTRPAGRLTGGPFTVPGLKRTWWVGLRNTTGLGELRTNAHALLQEADDQMTGNRHTVTDHGSDWERHLYRLGVTDLIRGPSQEPGQIWLLPPPAGGPPGADETSFLQWIQDFLADERRADVRDKLGRGRHGERHCFIVCSESTDWVVNGQLSEFSLWLPSTPPGLPQPITHLWLFNVETGGRCLHYGPQAGWVQV